MFYLKLSVFCVVIVFCFIFIEHVEISSAQSPQVLQGIKDFQDGNYEKALQGFAEAYKQEPKNPLTSYYLGMANKYMQNFKEAARYLKIALDLDPKLTDLYYEIGDSLFQLGELKEADRYLDEAERFNVRPANTTMIRGLVFMGLGKTKEAIKYLNKAKELEKSIAQMVDYQIANLYMKDNDTTKAKEYFKAVVMADSKSNLAEIAKRYIDDTGLEPKEKKVSITEGRSLKYTDNVLKKTAVMSVAERVNPSVNFFEKGLAEFKAENYEEALVFFEKAYKERPMDPRITFYLGLTHRETQNYPEAVRFFKETLSLDPKAADVKFFLADTLFSILKYEEALSIIETAIKEGVRPAESNYLKGLILLKLNKNMEAVEAFKKAKELDPALTQQADFQIATAYTLEKEFKKAKKMFKGLITIDPTSDWALFSKDYLEALEKIPPPYRLILGIGLQYDDNVLVNPIDEALVDITKQEDLKRIYSLFGEYTLYSKGRWNIKTSYSLGINQHKERDYPKKTAGEKIFSQDTVSHTFSIMPSYNTEKSITSLLLSYNYLAIDYIRYKQAFTINPTFTFIIKGNHLGQALLKYKREEFDRAFSGRKFGSYPSQAEDRDAHYSSAGLGYLYTFSKGDGLFNARLEGDVNDTDGINWDYTGVKTSAGLLYPFFNNKFKVNIFSEMYNQNFSKMHTIYRKKRRDDTYTVQTSLTYSIIKPMDISIGYTHIKTDSNITIYEYKRNLYTSNLEYRF